MESQNESKIAGSNNASIGNNGNNINQLLQSVIGQS